MQSNEEMMLSAVLHDPTDETARLVYADAVQERDETRAAFIRSHAPCVPCGTLGSFGGVLTFHEGKPIDNQQYTCHRCVGKGWVPFCQESGCRQAGRLCVIEPEQTAEYKRAEDWYCGEHAIVNGYCASCGAFWGGVDSFERNGICDHCADQLEADYEEEREWEDEHRDDVEDWLTDQQ